MSAEVNAPAIVGEVAAVAVGVPAAVAVGGAAVAVGVAAVGIAAIGVAAGAVGYGIIKGFQTAGECIQIVKREKEYERNLVATIKKLTSESNDDKNLEKMVDRTKDFFERSNTFFSASNASKMLDQKRTISEKVSFCYELLEIESKYSTLEKKMAALDELAEKTGSDINEFLTLFNNICTNDPAIARQQIEELTSQVNEEIDKLYEAHEEELKNMRFEARFIEVENVEEKTIIAVFNEEIKNLLEAQEGNEKIKELLQEKDALEMLFQVNRAAETILSNKSFADYSEKILTLWGDCLTLSNNRTMTKDDYRYEIDLKLQSLVEIEKLMNRHNNQYGYKKAYGVYADINSELRRLLNLDPIKYKDEDIDEEDLKKITKDNKCLADEYKKKHIANHISLELKKRYAAQNYQFIQTNTSTGSTGMIIQKSYFITPDEKNILCVNVNEKGKINQEVVGVKIYGLQDDKQSIFNAQKAFCPLGKKVLKELGVDNEQISTIEPDINATALAKDFSGKIPQWAINKVKQKREKKNAASELKKKAINYGNNG